MTFLAPLWLLSLLPWLAVTVWLLRKRRRPTAIPFIDLWQRGPEAPPKPARNYAPPPVPLALAMLAMLLALLAAAEPGIRGRAGRPVTIVVDRGASMSAGGPRFLDASKDVVVELGRRRFAGRVNLSFVAAAGPVRTDAAGWLPHVARAKRTAISTGPSLWATVARRLAESDDPVLAVTDQPSALSDERLIVVGPPEVRFRNVGIAHVAARESPRPQVMVTVESTSRAESLTVRVCSGGQDTLARLEASPSASGRRNLFVDVPVLGPVLDVRLDTLDDAPADDRAWLVRQGNWPRVEAHAAFPAALDRFITAYASGRPPVEASPRVRVVERLAEAAGEEPAVVLAAPSRWRAGSVGAVEVVSHPITRSVQFPASPDVVVDPAAPAGWTPVVTFGGKIAVAVREAPARQVWVGIGLDAWSRTPSFVVFWANVFEWLGGGAVSYTYHSPGTLGSEWQPVADGPADLMGESGLWPGLYQRAGGGLRAVNAPFIALPPAGGSDGWQARLGEMLRDDGLINLRPYLALAAVGCLAAAAGLWGGATLTEFSGKTTVATDGVLAEARAARAVADRRRITQQDPGTRRVTR